MTTEITNNVKEETMTKNQIIIKKTIRAFMKIKKNHGRKIKITMMIIMNITKEKTVMTNRTTSINRRKEPMMITEKIRGKELLITMTTKMMLFKLKCKHTS